MMRSLIATFAFALVCLTASVSSAHSVWIEALPDGQLCIRFAEWGEEFETSPGHLDSFTQVSGWAVGEKGAPSVFEIVKKSDHFLLTGSTSDKPAFGQAPFVVRKLHEDKPARAPIFYCRWQPEGGGAGTPAMTLDIVPTGQPGEARVYFRGKPLPDLEVGLHPPASDEIKLKTDAEGYVRVEDLSKAGPYLLTVARYSEDLPGYFLGVPFAITSHSASLYWTVSKK
ncbi:hypothetical protein SAMN02745166_00209 [Prosthecobacter debontii]|uniref:Nickel transport protein n=1 Tax=Prosthecobacter debontii TaxID=48467 RepID=A0A1T4WI79_9BACT|nr:hypothetical protein [Prosthecobacter debontii]SKA76605.1 hypothetical protein SAMN02745166_00209 [Prosthecobacter debontii]